MRYCVYPRINATYRLHIPPPLPRPQQFDPIFCNNVKIQCYSNLYVELSEKTNADVCVIVLYVKSVRRKMNKGFEDLGEIYTGTTGAAWMVSALAPSL